MPPKNCKRFVCVEFDQVNDLDQGCWVVADERQSEDGRILSSELVEGSGSRDRESAIQFATDRAKKTGATLIIRDCE